MALMVSCLFPWVPGTNRYHGDMFEFLRNEKFDSRSFFEYNQVNPVTGQETPGTARGVLKRNQFGGTLGGPIKHDRAFFFLDYQGTRQRQAIPSGLVAVPSIAERSGDFSANAAALTGAVSGPYFAQLLSQKLGYAIMASEPYYTPGCTSATCVFPGFPGAIIPQSVFSAPAQAMMKYIPPPTSGYYFISSANDVKTRDDRGECVLTSTVNAWAHLPATTS
jgi:hypothetical protein